MHAQYVQAHAAPPLLYDPAEHPGWFKQKKLKCLFQLSVEQLSEKIFFGVGSLPEQDRVLPVPELAYPEEQTHVDAPTLLVLPLGQAVQGVPATV